MKKTRASLQVNMITDQNKRQIPRRSPGLIGPFASWLNQPFMFPSSALARFQISFGFGIFVFLFLRIFLPFGLGSIPVNKTLFISVYGISTTFIISTWLFILPLFSPGMFNKEQYTIRKYLVLCFGNIMLIDIINWIYTRTAGADFLPHNGFFLFTLFTFSVGVFPVVFLTLLIDKIRTEIKTSHVGKMQVIRPEAKELKITQADLTIRNSEGAVLLCFSEKEFICARSNENYTQVYYRQNNSVRKELVRLPITKFYDQVKDGASIVRCHRSAIINIKYIKQIYRKSRSIQLQLEHVDEWVPVSRDFPRSLLYNPFSGQEVNKTNPGDFSVIS